MVTGATGFFGGHVVRALIDEGYEPHLFVRSEAKLEQLIEMHDLPRNLSSAVGDILDAGAVAKAVAGADACVHTAAFTSFDPAESHKCLEINPAGAKVVLDAAVTAGCDP